MLKTLFPILSLLSAQAAGERTPVHQQWVPTVEYITSQKENRRKLDGFITQKPTAIKVARALIVDQLGTKLAARYEPYNAKRFEDVWVVYGSGLVYTSDRYSKVAPVIVELSASTGTVLNFGHYTVPVENPKPRKSTQKPSAASGGLKRQV